VTQSLGRLSFGMIIVLTAVLTGMVLQQCLGLKGILLAGAALLMFFSFAIAIIRSLPQNSGVQLKMSSLVSAFSGKSASASSPFNSRVGNPARQNIL
jgi:hypothetical protein